MLYVYCKKAPKKFYLKILGSQGHLGREMCAIAIFLLQVFSCIQYDVTLADSYQVIPNYWKICIRNFIHISKPLLYIPYLHHYNLGPNVLCQTENWIAYCASPKLFVPVQTMISNKKFNFCDCPKFFGVVLNQDSTLGLETS